MPADEQVADTDWIDEAAKREWPILMKDKRIRRRDRARGSLLRHHQRRCRTRRPRNGNRPHEK
jgi:hypothetical protein